jgi:hypothetical protein
MEAALHSRAQGPDGDAGGAPRSVYRKERLKRALVPGLPDLLRDQVSSMALAVVVFPGVADADFAAAEAVAAAGGNTWRLPDEDRHST